MEAAGMVFECPASQGGLMKVYIGQSGPMGANGEYKWMMVSESMWCGREFSHTLAVAESKAALVELAMCWGMLEREEA